MPNVRKRPSDRLTWRRTVCLLPEEGSRVESIASRDGDTLVSAMRKMIRRGMNKPGKNGAEMIPGGAR